MFSKFFNMHAVYFKIKSLLLHCGDHSFKFVYGPRWFYVCHLTVLSLQNPPLRTTLGCET